MCCFSRPVERVASTRIFARATGRGTQWLAYAMDLAAAGDLAMILPLPTRPEAGEGAVRFLDLSGYEGLFRDLAAGFPMDLSLASVSRAPQSRAARLVVHEVGSFDASFVPTAADFDRLDPRFRLPPDTFADLPALSDFGFAVFVLRDPRTGWSRWWAREPRPHIHPMAFEFASRAPDALFFPTLHVHDGHAHPTAEFDHTLYAQAAEGPRAEGDDRTWESTGIPARSFLSVDRAGGLLDPDAPCLRTSLVGPEVNGDRWCDAAAPGPLRLSP